MGGYGGHVPSKSPKIRKIVVLITLIEVLQNHTLRGAHDNENKPPGGAGRSAKGDTGTTGTAVGTWMGKGGGEGQTGGKEEKEGWEGLRFQTNKQTKQDKTQNTSVIDTSGAQPHLGEFPPPLCIQLVYPVYLKISWIHCVSM